MKANGNIKPAASLDASLLARKGHAQPAVAATVFNNPALAWARATEAPHAFTQPQPPANPQPVPPATPGHRPDHKPDHKRMSLTLRKAEPRPVAPKKVEKGDAVAMIFKIDEADYLRLKYQAQRDGHTSQELIRRALTRYLDAAGAPTARRWRVQPD